MLTQKIDQARGLSEKEYTPEEAKRLKKQNKTSQGSLVKSFVYGGLDGTVTTFAVVAGVAGADLATSVVLILGVANLIADGISMAFGDYLGTRAENDYINTKREGELWKARNDSEREKNDMIELYMEKGISETDSKTVVSIVSKYEKSWVDIMMVEKLGLIENGESPVKSALTTFGSFVLFGSIPVLIYAVAKFIPFVAEHTFFTACVLTGITLFILGTLKVVFTKQVWYRAGTEMLVLGGLAAASAYIIGVWLGRLA